MIKVTGDSMNRTPVESYFDPTPSEEYVKSHHSLEDRDSFDEPPF
jgi:hypothetical protein